MKDIDQQCCSNYANIIFVVFYVINKTARCYIVYVERTAAALVDALQAVLSTISLNQLRTWTFWLSWLH